MDLVLSGQSTFQHFSYYYRRQPIFSGGELFIASALPFVGLFLSGHSAFDFFVLPAYLRLFEVYLALAVYVGI